MNNYLLAPSIIAADFTHLAEEIAACESAGADWLQSGAENPLRLRAVAENNDWVDYFAYRKLQRRQRLYGSLPANLEPIEGLSLTPRHASHAPVVGTVYFKRFQRLPSNAFGCLTLQSYSGFNSNETRPNHIYKTYAKPCFDYQIWWLESSNNTISGAQMLILRKS